MKLQEALLRKRIRRCKSSSRNLQNKMMGNSKRSKVQVSNTNKAIPDPLAKMNLRLNRRMEKMSPTIKGSRIL